MADERKVKLRSRDGDAYELLVQAAKLSKLVATTLDCSDEGEDSSDEGGVVEIELPKVGSNCLSQVVLFMNHYAEEKLEEIKTPLEGDDLTTIIKQEWYRSFISADQSMIFELVTAANFMEIQPLLDLACLRVSIDLVGKSAEEIRTILNIPKMTAEEEAAARRDHRWIFED